MKKLLLLFVACLGVSLLQAQNYCGTIDTSFNSADVGLSYGTPVGGDIWNITKLPDGRVLIFGGLGYYNGQDWGPMRLPNGDPDTVFNNNLDAAGIYGGYGAYLLDNGQMFIYGAGIRKVNPDGTEDTSFDDYSMTGLINSIAVQTNGKIIAGGNMYATGASYGRIIRLNADGSRDNSFYSNSTTYDAQVNKVIIQSTGKIVAVGEFTKYHADVQNRIIRLDTTGYRDDTYTVNGSSLGFYNAKVKNLYQLGDTLIAVGKFGQFNGATRGGVCRILPNGANDPTFANLGIGQTVMDIERNADGSYIIIEGNGNGAGDNYVYVKKISTNGVLDPSFHVSTGFQRYAYGRSLAILSDGKIIAVGQFNKFDYEGVGSIVRLNPDGTRDDAYPLGTSVDNFVLRPIALNDGKFLIAGVFSRYYTTPIAALAKLNSDGSLDATFNAGGTGPGTINAVAVPCVSYMDTLSDGSIFLSGNFTTYNGQAVAPIIKLHADGTLDNTFTYTGTTVSQPIKALSNGKVLIYGSNGNFKRLNADGSADNTFTTYSSETVNDIDIQADGKIIVAGAMQDYTVFLQDMNIVRLNTDGTRDMTFTVPYHFSTDYNYSYSAVAVLSSGKILVAGNYLIPNMVSKYIMRLNADGTIDNTFNVGGTGFTSTSIYSIKEQRDGKILIYGSFTTYNGQPANNVVRIMPDGSIDNSFNIAGTIARTPSTITPIGQVSGKIITGASVAPNGSIFFGGSFTQFDGQPRNRISISKNLLVFAPVAPNDTLCVGVSFNLPVHVLGNLAAGNTYTVELSNSAGSFASPTIIGTLQSANDTVIIPCTLPLNTAYGTQYRIRYKTSDLVGLSNNNGSNLVVIAYPPQPSAFILSSNTVCQGQNNVHYSIQAQAGYTYVWSYGGTGVTFIGSSNSVTANFSSTATTDTLRVSLKSVCGAIGPPLKLKVTVNQLPVQPSAFIAWKDTVCAGQQNVIYAITATQGNNYTWAYSGTGATITNLGDSIKINFSANATSGIVSVYSSNACGQTQPINKPVYINHIPVTPTFTTSTANVCHGVNGVVYTLANISNATSYSWFYTGTGVTINGTGNSVLVNFSSTATPGILNVQALNACGISDTLSLAIQITNAPPAPVFTASVANICPGQTGVIYTVTNISGATYQWTYSGTGATINGNGNSIMVDFANNATSGSLSVTTTTLCSDVLGPVSTAINVGASAPVLTQFSASEDTVCLGQTGVAYSVVNVGADTYTWTYTGTGVTLYPNGNTLSVNFSQSATSGILSVVATNSCGQSIPLTMTVQIMQVPSTPVFINSQTVVCPGQSGVQYEVTHIQGATYTWSYSGTNAIINGSGSSVVVDFASNSTSGSISVTATTICGVALQPVSIAVNIGSSAPVLSQFTASEDTVCRGQNGVIYSVPLVGADTYTWSYSGTGATLNPSGNTVSINFSQSATGGVLSVVAANSCGQSTPLTMAVQTMQLATTPVLTVFTTNVCPGQSNVIYTVNNNPGVTYNWSYNGTGATINGVGNSISINFANNATSGTLSVSATNYCGTTSAATVAITIPQTPVTPVFAASTDTVCPGQANVIYTVSNANGVTYNWTYSGTGATINGTGNTVTIDFANNATSGTLYVTAANNCSTTAPATIAIHVQQPPAAPVFINSQPAICPGQTNVQYDVTYIPGATYVWSYSGTGATINGSGNSVTVDFNNAPTAGNLTVVVTTICGIALNPVSIAVNVNSAGPTLSQFNTYQDTVCQSQNSIIYSVTNVNGATYAWSYSGSGVTLTPNGNSISIDFSSIATSGTLSVTATNLCGQSAPLSMQISVIPPPQQPVFITSTSTLCQGQTGVQYGVTNVQPLNYTWLYSGSGATINGTGSSVTVDFANNATSGTLSVSFTTPCGLQLQTQQVQITVNSAPDALAQFDVSSDTVIAGQQDVEYTVPLVNGVTYNWTYTGTDATINGTGNSITINFDSTATSGTLSVTVTGGCGTSNPLTLDINVFEVPGIPGGFIEGEDTTYWGDQGVVYTIPDERSGDVESYQWSFDGLGATINGSGASITMDFPNNSSSGILTVTAVNQWGVSQPRTMFITVLEPVGLNNATADVYKIYVYQNMLLCTSPAKAVLSIYDMAGRQVMPNTTVVKGTNELPLNSLIPGIYLVRMVNGNKQTSPKIIITE